MGAYYVGQVELDLPNGEYEVLLSPMNRSVAENDKNEEIPEA